MSAARQAHDDAIRSPSSVALSLLVAGAICLLPMVPAVRAVLGVTPGDVAIAMSVFAVLMIGGAIAYRRCPPGSPVFALFDRIETVLIQAAVLSLVLASGRGDSFFWLLWVIHAMLSGTGAVSARFNIAAFAVMPSLVAVGFVAIHDDLGAAAQTVVIGGLGLYVYWLALTAARKLAAADADRARLAGELADTRVRQERQRIARDIHDGLGTDLAALDWRLRGLRGTPDLEAEIDGLVDRLAHGSRELRAIVWSLRTQSRGWSELVTYVRMLSRELCGDAIACEVVDDGHVAFAVPGGHSIDFLRAVLELVHNAARHAGAAHVRVVLGSLDGALVATVEDDGRGLPSGVLDRDEGGLANLRHRVARANGAMTASAREGGGTRITIRVPIVCEQAGPMNMGFRELPARN